MTKDAYNAIKGFSNVTSITPNVRKPGEPDQVYPTNPNHPVGPPNLMLPGKQHDYKWNVDNYGPIIIPKKGWTVKLDSLTFPIYRRAIQVYENNKLELVGNDILINGKKTKEYTFKLNYYWMMGDNRHNSEDSRFWGFVPEDHIVGQAKLVWMSWEKGVRWKRLFRKIR